MGHVHLPPLPQTRKWKQIIQLIASGATARQGLAAEILKASERGLLRRRSHDHGVLETATGCSFACRSRPGPPLRWRRCGIAGSTSPTHPDLLDIAVAFTAAVDARMANNRGRTDLGEMAQNAAVEAINAVVGPRSQSLYGSGSDEVRSAAQRLLQPSSVRNDCELVLRKVFLQVLGLFPQQGRAQRDRRGRGSAPFWSRPSSPRRSHPLPRGQRRAKKR